MFLDELFLSQVEEVASDDFWHLILHGSTHELLCGTSTGMVRNEETSTWYDLESCLLIMTEDEPSEMFDRLCKWRLFDPSIYRRKQTVFFWIFFFRLTFSFRSNTETSSHCILTHVIFIDRCGKHGLSNTQITRLKCHPIKSAERLSLIIAAFSNKISGLKSCMSILNRNGMRQPLWRYLWIWL